MSSTEAATASWVQATDPMQSASGMFDAQLKLLSEVYLAFFQERKRLEQQYVAALNRLHKKYQDAYMENHLGELNTLRVVWGEITDNVEREAGTHVAVSESLGTYVIEPLSIFKEEQDRIRKRVRENIKEATAAHIDYAENVLPRLKRAYIRKCQEAEEYKSAATVVAPSTQSSISAPDPNHMPPLSKPQSNPANGARPIVTGPQPLRPLDRRPSLGAHRNRSPSGAPSTALQDLAHQGKKQLNQLMTFLDRDGGRSDNAIAIRQVRAKREADEADKEYRKGVHYLETLRLRRIKTVESGLKSLEAFVRESSEVVKKVLEIYTDNLTGAAATQKQLCEHGRRMADKIVPQQDSATIATQISGLIAAATPKPVHYYNYNVGECKDLVFGVSLVDYATSHGTADGDLPKIVRMCIDEIDRRGLEIEGLYRVSGRYAAVLELQHKIERNEATFAFNPNADDVHTISSLLKMYLRELPEPVFKFPLQDRMQHTEDFDDHAANNFAMLRSKIRRLPPIHQATLKAIMEHLARVASHSSKNKMDSKNLAIVFGTFIFGEDEMPKGGDLLGMQSWKDTFMEDIINNAHVLFQQTDTDSPPRSNALLSDLGAPNAYSSSPPKGNRTSMPPPPIPIPPRKQHQKSASVNTVRASLDSPRPVPQDFTPDLPPRPANSIHPSLRAGVHASPARHSPTVRAGQFFDDALRVTPQASLSSSQEGPDNSSSTSLPPPLPPRNEELSGPSTDASSADTDASATLESYPQEASSKRSSRQLPIPPLSELREQSGDGISSYSDRFLAPSPSREQFTEAGIELSSTASAAAFAFASPSPTSSSSGHSSPSKKSGHGQKGSD